MEDAKSLGKLCICGVRGSIDGAWLATRLVGDSGIPGSVAGVLASTMRLVAAALRHAEIRSERDVANFFAYSPVLNELSLESTPVAARWRGLTLRHRAVTSWRTLWAFLSHYARGAGGFVPLDEVQAWLADQAPDLTVRSFMATLPETMRGGFTQPAEPSCERLDLPEPISHLAQILLSGIRANELPPAVEWGYLGEPNDTDRAQELSPLWVARSIEQWQDRALRDYCLYIVRVLVDRSQRVALDKAGFRRGRFVLPARVLVRDGFLEWTDGEGALVPPLRLERLFHVGRQVSLFDTDGDGRWTIGERGDFLDSSY